MSEHASQSAEPKNTVVLIIEDEASLRVALCDKFTREHFTVFDAKDGEAGLAVAYRVEPDVILLDMMMPKMDGITMLRQLRVHNDWGKKVPVLLLTNVSSDDKRMLKEVSGDTAAHYLVKSDWPIEKLVKKVREVVAQ